MGVKDLSGGGRSWTKFLCHDPIGTSPGVFIDGEQELFPGFDLSRSYDRFKASSAVALAGGRSCDGVTAAPGFGEPPAGVDGGPIQVGDLLRLPGFGPRHGDIAGVCHSASEPFNFFVDTPLSLYVRPRRRQKGGL